LRWKSGFSDLDVKRLGIAATLHDIGKAHIPLLILDKPDRLDPGEEEIMRSHPAIGYELLKNIEDITPEIHDGVRQPPRISGRFRLSRRADGAGDFRSGKIADDLRYFRRSHRGRGRTDRQCPVKTPTRSCCGMDGKLERPLVKAFRNVALVV